jgi:hypothetical protein
LLANQQVSITQSELEQLIKIPKVKFDLPLNDQTYPSFVGLVGRPKTRGWKAGVYIFTHIPTGDKYVGSSNSLSRRLDQYFTPHHHLNQEDSGLLLPLIKKEGFDKFSLEILVMPPKLAYNDYFLFLEQYYLLHESFNLNTQRIVNFRVNQGKNVYLYDQEGLILYYSSKSFNQIKGDLGIHITTCKNCIKTGQLFLDFFKISDSPIEGAIKADLSFSELTNLISEKRKIFLSQTFKKTNSLAITIKDTETGEIFEFSSIIATVRYFKSKNITVDRNIIAKCLNTNKPYKGYIYSKKQ